MAAFTSKASTFSVAFTFALLVLCMVSVMADLPRLEHPTNDDGFLSFLVVGDWGRKGKYNQSEVAHQMGKVGERLNVDFIISTGDNFYEHGLTGVDDPKFEESFTNIYIAESLQKQWYSVLGNHDYRGNVEAQLSPVLTKLDSKWLCMRSFILNAEIVEFIFVDTTPFVDNYFTDPGEQTYDWSGVLPRHKYLSNLLKDVDLALRESTARWKIVIGHHTMKSAGVHGNTEELNRLLLPVLEENNVDLYINGHDHCMEHIKTDDSSIEFFTSGGGSKAWRGIFSWMKPEELKFYHDGQGFMSAEMTQDKIDVVFYDVFGEAIYKWGSSKGHAAV